MNMYSYHNHDEKLENLKGKQQENIKLETKPKLTGLQGFHLTAVYYLLDQLEIKLTLEKNLMAQITHININHKTYFSVISIYFIFLCYPFPEQTLKFHKQFHFSLKEVILT